MDGNDVLDSFDIDDFILALKDIVVYREKNKYINPLISGDMDGNGVLDSFDYNIFELALKQLSME